MAALLHVDSSHACRHAVIVIANKVGFIGTRGVAHVSLGIRNQMSECAAAAGDGNLDELRRLRANGCPWDESTCYNAAHGGHLETLIWAHINGCEWDEWTCHHATCGGHLKTLQWARANRCPWWRGECVKFATDPATRSWITSGAGDYTNHGIRTKSAAVRTHRCLI